MCLTDKIFLQTHVTFCEYLVFHEFKRNLVVIYTPKNFVFCFWVYIYFKYQNHIKIFTDGSVLDSLDSGAGFVIPELKV